MREEKYIFINIKICLLNVLVIILHICVFNLGLPHLDKNMHDFPLHLLFQITQHVSPFLSQCVLSYKNIHSLLINVQLNFIMQNWSHRALHQNYACNAYFIFLSHLKKMHYVAELFRLHDSRAILTATLHLGMGTVGGEEPCNLLKLNNTWELHLISKCLTGTVFGQTFKICNMFRHLNLT